MRALQVRCALHSKNCHALPLGRHKHTHYFQHVGASKNCFTLSILYLFGSRVGRASAGFERPNSTLTATPFHPWDLSRGNWGLIFTILAHRERRKLVIFSPAVLLKSAAAPLTAAKGFRDQLFFLESTPTPGTTYLRTRDAGYRPRGPPRDGRDGHKRGGLDLQGGYSAHQHNVKLRRLHIKNRASRAGHVQSGDWYPSSASSICDATHKKHLQQQQHHAGSVKATTLPPLPPARAPPSTTKTRES